MNRLVSLALVLASAVTAVPAPAPAPAPASGPSPTTTSGSGGSGGRIWLSPEYTAIFENPLPIPPRATVSLSWTNATTGKSLDYYEVYIRPFEAEIYKGHKTSLVGYNSTSPGPTFMMTRGRESIVRFINEAKNPASIHLHGSPSRVMFDGWAEDVTKPGEYKDYYYPNFQAQRTLWYHDHAFGITAVNAYYGQAGMYILTEPLLDEKLGLPTGKYDVPIVLAAKQYQANYQLVSPEFETVSLWGDVIHVNGQPWPHLKVEPRRYRFRVLDASVSRSFKLYLQSDKDKSIVPFQVIGSDAGLSSHAVTTNDLVIAMAERWEIIVDFSTFANSNVTMMNTLQFQTNIDYAATDKVMKFIVGNTITPDPPSPYPTLPPGLIPETNTLADLEIPLPSKAVAQRYFRFERKNGEWQINGITFADPVARVLARPELGSTEIWTLENGGGGWSHPVHIHLIDFKVLTRTGSNRPVEAYEATSLKDVVYLGMNEKVTVIAKYFPWAGQYMFHCHNLVHEDHDMMGEFNITMTNDIGVGQENAYNNPMDEKWRAKLLLNGKVPEANVTWLASMQALKIYDDFELVKTYFA